MIRLAATVMMLRPGGRTFEVVMLRRSAKSAFAPDVFVFPGGAVERSDYSQEPLARITGLNEERLARMYRAVAAPQLAEADGATVSTLEGRALIIAALRETFEEAGVLLGTHAIDHVAQPDLHQAREQLQKGTLSFLGLLQRCDLHLEAQELELFSQWITPPSEGRRFNAHFFIARAGGQDAIADRYETHDEIWITPQDALDRFASGSYAMVYPTIKHIERLAQFKSIEDALAFARHKPILRIMPHTTADNGFTLPRELENVW
ncbi:MAG: NUDIX hydrolase [Vulcanimicrobiaceae bacterium]